MAIACTAGLCADAGFAEQQKMRARHERPERWRAFRQPLIGTDETRRQRWDRNPDPGHSGYRKVGAPMRNSFRRLRFISVLNRDISYNLRYISRIRASSNLYRSPLS